MGETRDLGPSGLTLRLDRVRVGGQYLTDADHHLGVRLELPAGEVRLLAEAIRFKYGPEARGETGYTLGLRILKVRDSDRALYVGFLKTLAPLERRHRERERGRQKVLLATSGSEMSWGRDALTPQDVARAFENFLGRNQPGGRS